MSIDTNKYLLQIEKEVPTVNWNR